jgi:hypothetical protein
MQKTVAKRFSYVANWHWTLDIIAGLVAVGLSYIAVSLAINSGSLIQYAMTLVLFGIFVHYLRKGLWKLWLVVKATGK